MVIEFLRTRVAGRLSELGRGKVDLQEQGDYFTLFGYVVPRLQSIYSFQVGEVDAPQEGPGQAAAGALSRLMQKKGNSFEKIGQRLLEMGQAPDLSENKFLRSQYKAVILGSLKDLNHFPSGFEGVRENRQIK